MLDKANNMFKKRENVAEIEEGNLLSPKFDNDGLIPVVTTCARTKEILSKTFGDVNGYDDMVVQKNISVQSHCEHHMAPIIGVAHVAYIPNKRVVGLSKLARVVEVFSKRLQTQERLTMQIAKTLMSALDAKGVAVSIDSTHQCMTMRGIKKEQATTVTNYYLGSFKDDLSYQNRYLRFISK